MTQIKPGYYRRQNGKLVKVIHVSTNGRVFCEDQFGEKTDVSRDQIETAERLTNYRPGIAELFELTKSRPFSKDQKAFVKERPKFKDDLRWHNRLKLFFAKLIEFDHLKINTRGYYYKKAAHNKESLAGSIAHKMAERFYFAFSMKSERAEAVKKHFLAWAQNPNEETRRNLFLNPPDQILSELHIDQECRVTGATFIWSCDGKTIRPIHRQLDREEEEEVKTKLREELTELRALKTSTSKQADRITYLADLLETDSGWMRSYRVTGITPVVPFKQAYADPATGEFPRTVVEIDIPTGQLVFANSLFEYLKDFDKDNEFAPKNSVNHIRGRANTTRFHAQENQAFFVPVGNNCPHVWQKKGKSSSLRIGSPSEEPRGKEWTYEDATKHWHDRGYITTDLWAFHACDRSRLPEKIEVSHFIVKVPPGRYRLTNHYDHDGHRTGIFCEIEKATK